MDELTRHLRTGLAARLETYAQQGHAPTSIGTAAEVARRMLEVLPSPSRWNDLIGPFYGTRQVSEVLGGISRQAVSERRQRRTLLGLKTADGVMVYPTFQFSASNELLPGLAEVLRCFPPEDVDDWTLAGWLVSPLADLEGLSVVDWLRQGRELAQLLTVARDAARRFRQ